jgi:hypothetical protein
MLNRSSREEEQTIASYFGTDVFNAAKDDPASLRFLLSREDPEASLPGRVTELLSSPEGELPAGYATIPGYFVRHEGAGWYDALMQHSLLELHAHEDAWAAEESARLGIPVATVPAAPAFEALGVKTQLAFQKGLIAGMPAL